MQKNQQSATSNQRHSPPSQTYPNLFKAVHDLRIFPDAKAMSDVIPKYSSELINQKFKLLKVLNRDSLKQFVFEHFEVPGIKESGFETNMKQSVTQHINRLWDVLKREKDPVIEGSSLVPLPHPYIVPGGRFNEIYYWDSYFTMLGLRESGKIDLIESMIDNFAYQISLFGHIPNGNRTYFISRSQPPFFALMVELLAESRGTHIYEKYLNSLITEHSFWMQGSAQISESSDAVHRLGLKDKGVLLNRYWDNLDTPRDEMYPDDLELAAESRTHKNELFRHLRAACESGWDFSARWLDDPMDLATIHAGNILPIDLNCLLYQIESTIAIAYGTVGNMERKSLYSLIAEKRKSNIQATFWDEVRKYYFDFLMHKERLGDVYSLAGVFPLFFKIATKDQASHVAQVIENHFLRPGGLVSTPILSGQQWDAPNGWAPLQYMTIKGLLNYGYNGLAKIIADRWLALNESVFKSTGKMMEKYNVEDLDLDAGGGEYPVQDGFGWTNGVYLALKALNYE